MGQLGPTGRRVGRAEPPVKVTAVDELPEPALIEYPYGTLQASWAVSDGEIVMDQSLDIRGTFAPPSEFAQVRDFFERVAAA
jgi:hypothetical protein